MRTVITTIKKEDLDKVLSKYMIEARENNQDLTIRELSPSDEYFNLTLDFKLKLPFEVHGLQTPDKILEKIEEMKTHPPTILLCKMLEVGVSARVTLSSHSIDRLTPCFPRFVFIQCFLKSLD